MTGVKVIFLDVDGCLNSTKTWRALMQGHGCHTGGNRATCPELVARVNRLAAESGASIVVSSSWRSKSVTATRELFSANGITGRIIGCTPHLEVMVDGLYRAKVRGDEIQAWLDSYHRPVESFVILDDSDDMAHLLPHLVQIDPRVGVQDGDVERAMIVLNTSLEGPRDFQ